MNDFANGEDVYVIDKNGFDLWEGKIVRKEGSSKVGIHYPDYPEDDEGDVYYRRVLEKTERNSTIFMLQEEVRKKSEEEMERKKREKRGSGESGEQKTKKSRKKKI